MSEGAARGITAHVMSGSEHNKGVMFVTIGIALAEHFTQSRPAASRSVAPPGRLFYARDEVRLKVVAERVELRRCGIENAVDRFIVVCRRRPDVRATFAFGSFAT